MTQKYYKKHKKSLAIKARLRYRKNKKRHLKLGQNWRKKNPRRKKFLDRRWYKKNRKLTIARARRHYRKNKVKILAHKKHQNEHDLAWRKRQLTRMRNSQLKRTYGISLKQFSTLRRRQKNRCCICKSVFLKTPCVDHNHNSGKVRGLLCRLCNVGLGAFNDSSIRLSRAADYLKEFEK